MSLRNWLLIIVGTLVSLWIGVGRWAFDAGGELTWWYFPLIAVPFALLQYATVHRLRIADRLERTPGKAVFLSLGVSWLCGIGFGFTVPDLVDGMLVSVLSRIAGSDWIEISIALCNPFGIIALAGGVAALLFALAVSRDPRPSEDELIDLGEIDLEMVRHPLDR